MVKNIKFVLKVTGIHVFTYIFCGVLFSILFDYHSLFSMQGVDIYMKEMGSTSTLLGPLVQVIRGILFGLVLLLFQEVFIDRKYGWLKLWLILTVIGIINTPGPAPFSIEGIVYTKLPLEFHLKGAPEIIIQTLMFSCLLTKPSNNKKIMFIENNKRDFVAAITCMVLFSLTGIILALIIGADIASSVSDIGAFGVMFIAILSTFFMSKNYTKLSNGNRDVITCMGIYVVIGVIPFIYNFITKSVYNTPLTLLINTIPALIILLIIKLNYKSNKNSRQ